MYTHFENQCFQPMLPKKTFNKAMFSFLSWELVIQLAFKSLKKISIKANKKNIQTKSVQSC